MKSWKCMVDWALSPENKVNISNNILSTGKPGESCQNKKLAEI